MRKQKIRIGNWVKLTPYDYVQVVDIKENNVTVEFTFNNKKIRHCYAKEFIEGLPRLKTISHNWSYDPRDRWLH